MRANRKRDTGPEMRLRRWLHARGLRYRVNYVIHTDDGRMARPDIALPSRRLAVFIDGCFWHGCSAHGTNPRTNSVYWTAKIDGNKSRDLRDNEALRESGWVVLRIWEHEAADDAGPRVLKAARFAGHL
jgi:DNA mismatch endonuclease (patch repair protein)